MEYKLSKGIGKGIVGAIVFLIPIVLANFPVWADITLGSVGLILVNWLKFRYLRL